MQGMLSWTLPTDVSSAACVRVVGLKKKPEPGVIPVYILDRAKGERGEEQLRKLEMKYAMVQEKNLGGHVIRPMMDWDEVHRVLRDEVQPAGVEARCMYVRDNVETCVTNEKEWGDCMIWVLCQLRRYLLKGGDRAGTEEEKPAFRLYPTKLR